VAKILNRVLGLAGVAILASSLGALAACGEPADENAAAKETVSNANVALTLYDDNGIAVGEGSGILIAPKTVLTAAHLVAGKGKWTVTSADGKTKVNGIRGQTFDWRKYDSNLAHPRKHDVAVIFLDRPIQLASYPKIATTALPNGEQVMRVRNSGGGFQMIDSSIDRVRQMPNAYVTSMPSSETLDTGGAVVNKKGEIVGVVTGRGMQTGKLYVAKLGEVMGWLSNKATCGGTAKGGALAIHTIGTPPPKEGCTKDGGTSSSSSGGSSSGGSSSGGSSSGASGSSSGGSSSGASGSSSGGSSSGSNGSGENDSDSGKCEVGGGYEYPGGGGSPGVSDATGVNGGTENGSVSGSGTGGGTGSGDGSGTGTGGGSTTGTNGGTETGSTGTNTGGTGSGTGTGTGGGTGTGTNGGTETGATGTGTGTGGGAGSTSGTNTGSTTGVIPGGSGGAGSGSADEEVCEGESDNPDVCPPESINCEGPTCGGAFKSADNTIDYGACSCTSINTDGTGSIVLH
jgi:hypothetical protein